MSKSWPIAAVVLAFWIGTQSEADDKEAKAGARQLQVDSIVLGDFDAGKGVRLTATGIEIRGVDEDGKARSTVVRCDSMRSHQLMTDYVWMGSAGSYISKEKLLLRNRGDHVEVTPAALRMVTWGGDATLFALEATWPQGKKSKVRAGTLVLRDHENKETARLPK